VSDASLPAAASGLSAVGTSYVLARDGKLVTRTHYGPETTTQALVNRGASAVRSNTEPDRWTAVDIIDSTSDPFTISATYFGLYAANPSFRSLQVHKLQQDKARIVTSYENAGTILDNTTSTLDRDEWFRLNPADPTKTQVFVAECRQLSGSNYLIRLAPNRIRRTCRQFDLYTTVTSTTFPDHQSIVDTKNNPAFYGLGIGTVSYMGCRGKARVDLSTNRVFQMRYSFWSDPNGIFRGLAGLREVFIHTASVTVGWTDVTTFGASFAAQSVTSADYSVF
jgi:hypothetical protein